MTSCLPTIHPEAPRCLFGDVFSLLVSGALNVVFLLPLLLRWGRIRPAERVEAHPITIYSSEPSFSPMCGQWALNERRSL